MSKVRNGVFETNSSSVHVMAIPKICYPDKLNIPKEVSFKILKPEDIEYSDPTPGYDSKDFLYTYMVYYYCLEGNNLTRQQFLEKCEKIRAILYVHGVEEVKFEGLEWNDELEEYSFEFLIENYKKEFKDFREVIGNQTIDGIIGNSQALLNFLFNRDDCIFINDWDWDHEKELNLIHRFRDMYITEYLNY